MTNLQDLLSPPGCSTPQAELDGLVALYAQSQLNDALAQAAQLMQRYPACEILHNITGAVAAAAGHPETAVALYDRAIAIAPDYFEAFNNRGNASVNIPGQRQSAHGTGSFNR